MQFRERCNPKRKKGSRRKTKKKTDMRKPKRNGLLAADYRTICTMCSGLCGCDVWAGHLWWKTGYLWNIYQENYTVSHGMREALQAAVCATATGLAHTLRFTQTSPVCVWWRVALRATSITMLLLLLMMVFSFSFPLTSSLFASRQCRHLVHIINRTTRRLVARVSESVCAGLWMCVGRAFNNTY